MTHDAFTQCMNWIHMGVGATIKAEAMSSKMSTNPALVARWMRRIDSRSQATNDKGTSKCNPSR
jgi:hypothetical protein